MSKLQSPLTVTALSKRFADVTVLAGVDLTLAAGEVLCILGPNGAGKTTLISAILGLVAADSGEVKLLGQTQHGTSRSKVLRQQCGVMMQIGSLSANLTVAEQCDLFSSYYQNGYRASELVSLAGLDAHAKVRFGNLSGGQKQRLLFALALTGKPKLVFLDEPTLGMDVEARRNLWQQIRQLKQQGVAVVLTTHYLEEAEQLADRIMVLHQGQFIANGSPQQLKALTQYKVVQCCCSLTDAELQALPGVLQLSRQQGLVTLHSSQAEHTVKALFNQDPAISQLEVKPVALEQAFLQLTAPTAEQTSTNKEQAA
ncbi:MULTISPECIES: ABC transporter ATP-binding protein [unclassified Arsukibacterium]|uniref:ABC transporter ATP-binding protein n=1 Tax=unclassified Arsukibacterium TaxID=2635278 RepID=UPI000C35C286|nr:MULTISPECIES: ABC transporter ATP-binding protein [unclassified Arsukibacterium]MAA94676.1 ABC transporter [Rheinheimera sp.]MBM32740.1 ABC transporter [Rheinheimera sp.]|tara:strand:+ start:489 stop:1427 length:939 start_codon:yes stop_codon:yes gene_type:complete